MAEDKNKAAGERKTMAPAARPPAGEDERVAVADGGWPRELGTFSDRELGELETAMRAERQRRARAPREPSFGMSEGERDELERTGRTVSPFTGEKRGDWPSNPADRGAGTD